MQIRKLTAALGLRETAVLDFAPGLNIVKTPSEASTAAWTALLRDMFYGPDPGAPPRIAVAQCYLEAATAWGAVTITRWTASEDAPLGTFSAVYTGGMQPAAHLTADNCGEVMLGVPREIFDRRAVIRGTGLGDGNAALEELRAIDGVLEEDQAEYAYLQAQAAQFEEQIDRHDRADLWEAALAAENAHLDFVSVRDKVKTMEASQKNPPSKAQLTALRSAMDHLDAQAGPIRQAGQRLEQAAKAYQFAQSALDAQKPVGMPPEESRPRPKPSWKGACWSLLTGVGMGVAAALVYRNWMLAVGVGIGLFAVLLALTVVMPLDRERKEWKILCGELREQQTREQAAYAALSKNAEAARAAHQDAEEAYNAVASIYKAGVEHVMTLVHSFRPFAKDLEDARQAVADGLLMRKELDQAIREEKAARERWEALQGDAIYPLPPPVRRPAGSREQLRRDLADVRARMETLRARFTETLERCAEENYARMSRTRYHPGEPLEGDSGYQMELAARLAVCAVTLPGTAPMLLEGALDCLDGDSLTAALDCLTGMSQTRQVVLLTCSDREASCLRRTHPDRFHFIKL